MSEGPRGHPPDVIKAYEALPEEDDPSFFDALSKCRREVLIWKRRTLVDDTLQGRVDRIVIARCGKRITKTVRRYAKLPDEGRDQSDEDYALNEALAEASARFWTDIQQESGLEYRFNYYMMRLAQKTGEAIRGGKQGDLERRTDPLEDAQRELPDESDLYLLELAKNVATVEEGLRELPDRLSEPLRLHYLEAIPIFSKDPEVRDLGMILGYEESQTREIMREARAAFKSWAEGRRADD